MTGGYPEAQQRRTAARRQAWFDAYVATITQRDIRDWSNIADLTVLPRLLNLIALRSGALTNVAELARASGVAQATLHRYLTLLEASFLRDLQEGLGERFHCGVVLYGGEQRVRFAPRLWGVPMGGGDSI